MAAIRLGLAVFSYKTVRRWIPGKTGPDAAAPETVRRIRWAVRNSARLLPGASCLTQALAAQFLLARLGYRSRLQIGVAKDAAGQLLAHAWLISGDKIVIGGSSRDISRYALLPDVDLPAP